MNRIFAAFALAFSALSLSACSGFLEDVSSAPAPLEQTVIDERGLVLALETFDTTLTSVDILIETGYITPGSEKALQIADYIDSAKAWLQVASRAQRAGSTASYAEAITNARSAIAGVKAILSPD